MQVIISAATGDCAWGARKGRQEGESVCAYMCKCKRDARALHVSCSDESRPDDAVYDGSTWL
jgi:hypothetical protein